MKKAAGIAFAALMSALSPTAGAVAAAADCGAALSDLRARVAAAKADSVRQEAKRLLEKAEKDDRNGRSRACEDAVRRALTLVK
jgi:hypothetical protein